VKEAFSMLFQFKYKREVKSVLLKQIMTHYTFDVAYEDYEWAILKKSIVKKGLEYPVVLIRVRDIDPEDRLLDKHWMEVMLDGYYYLPMDGHHRVAVMKHLYKDDIAAIDAVIIEEKDIHIYNATYTPDLWCRDTDYGKIVKELDEIN
tara:strand:- start:163 stop:606 length:444 start_codon:yes stop_codon:yes gene_type:complete